MGAITALPHWTEESALKVAKVIIEMTHVKTAVQAKDSEDQTLKIIARPIRLVGKALSKNTQNL